MCSSVTSCAGLQVSFVGLTEEAAKEAAKKDGFEQAVKTVKTSFKANSKARSPGRFKLLLWLAPLRQCQTHSVPDPPNLKTGHTPEHSAPASAGSLLSTSQGSTPDPGPEPARHAAAQPACRAGWGSAGPLLGSWAQPGRCRRQQRSVEASLGHVCRQATDQPTTLGQGWRATAGPRWCSALTQGRSSGIFLHPLLLHAPAQSRRCRQSCWRAMAWPKWCAAPTQGRPWDPFACLTHLQLALLCRPLTQPCCAGTGRAAERRRVQHDASQQRVQGPGKHAAQSREPSPVAQALAELESDGMAKMVYRNDTGEILGVHIFGLHAADLIHEASNAVATKQTVQVRCRPRSGSRIQDGGYARCSPALSYLACLADDGDRAGKPGGCAAGSGRGTAEASPAA